jgi:hypothetical protein
MQVPYFFTQDQLPPGRVPGISNINFRCVLKEGLYQVQVLAARLRSILRCAYHMHTGSTVGPCQRTQATISSLLVLALTIWGVTRTIKSSD